MGNTHNKAMYLKTCRSNELGVKRTGMKKRGQAPFSRIYLDHLLEDHKQTTISSSWENGHSMFTGHFGARVATEPADEQISVGARFLGWGFLE